MKPRLPGIPERRGRRAYTEFRVRCKRCGISAARNIEVGHGMLLANTLSLAAAAVLINIWHFVRITQARVAGKIVHGDGGNEAMARRIR